MKSLRFMSSIVLMSISATVAFAQSDAQKSFDKLKTLAGSWEGTYEGKPVQASLRVTSMGNAIVHEMRGDGPENPITMLYLDGDRLLFTHFCDIGNRPRTDGKLSPDGKTVEFNFLDVGNYSSQQGGHMEHAVFTILDANHHTEDWTFFLEGKPAERGHIELHRTK